MKRWDMGSKRSLALIQTQDQGKARTMVERSLGMTAVPQERAASPDWSRRRKAPGKSIQLNRRNMTDSWCTYLYIDRSFMILLQRLRLIWWKASRKLTKCTNEKIFTPKKTHVTQAGKCHHHILHGSTMNNINIIIRIPTQNTNWTKASNKSIMNAEHKEGWKCPPRYQALLPETCVISFEKKRGVAVFADVITLKFLRWDYPGLPGQP